MDITLVIYTGLGAAIGSLIGSLLNRLHKTEVEKPRLYNVIFTVAGLTILPLLYRNMYLPRIVPMGTSDFGESAVFYQSLQKYDPKAYEKLIKPLDRLVRKGNLSPESLQETRLVLDEILAAKRKNANLKELRKETELSIWQLNILKAKAPKVCVQKVHGRPFQNLSELLPEDYQKQERDMLVALIENPNRPDDIVLDNENGSNLFTNFVQNSMSELKVVNLDPPENDVSAQESICELLVMVNERILNSSDQDVYDIYANLNK